MTDAELILGIEQLKKELNAVILAHYYQEGVIQDIADYVGDSLGLSQQAAATQADVIVFAGVHFMAETAKILSPQKKVLLPDLDAGCSLADSCKPEDFKKFIEKHPDHLVISYVNCSAAIKALTDIICTSSNAVKIVESLSPEQKIIFAPDKHLGAYVQKKTGRKLVLWDGSCMVHDLFSLKKIIQLKQKHPEALLVAHPECDEKLLSWADFTGSTTGILNFVKNSKACTFIVATEAGILHLMAKENPDKTLIPAPPENTCACNECPYMKKNTLEKLYQCMLSGKPEIVLDENIRERAALPIKRMLELSA